MMGAGKSTVAPLVAAGLGWPVLSTDEAVARRGGRSLADWLTDDPAGFRAAERAAVADAAAAGGDLVVDCGGGVVLDADSVAVMRSTGLVLWLEVPRDVLQRRVGSGESRPLLGGDPARVAAILAEREDLYRGAAHVTLNGADDAAVVAEEVMAAWRRRS